MLTILLLHSLSTHCSTAPTGSSLGRSINCTHIERLLVAGSSPVWWICFKQGWAAGSLEEQFLEFPTLCYFNKMTKQCAGEGCPLPNHNGAI